MNTDLYIYVYSFVYIYVFYLLSSPYLRVCGDDRVRGTREQMLVMQVAQVQLRRGEGIYLGNFSYVFTCFENNCKPWGVTWCYWGFSFVMNTFKLSAWINKF